MISDDLRAIEQVIFEQDAIGPVSEGSPTVGSSATITCNDYVRPKDVFGPLIYSQSEEHLVSPQPIKLEDLKVEVPISPYKEALPMQNHVTFNEFVEEMLLDDPLSEYQGSNSSLGEMMAPAAEFIKLQSEQEQLHEADSKGRVEIPKIDFTLPVPPWKHLQDIYNDTAAILAAQRAFLLDIMGRYGYPTTWPGANKLHSKLKWTPFSPDLAKVVLNELFEDEQEKLDAYVIESSQVNDSSALTWKQPGLRALKHDDDEDDDLEGGHFEIDQPQDMASLIRMRRKQYDEGKAQSLINTTASRPENLTPQSHIEARQMAKGKREPTLLGTDYSSGMVTASFKRRQEESSHYPSKEVTNILLGGGPFSTASAVENYLEIRGSKKQKPIRSAFFISKPLSRNSNKGSEPQVVAPFEINPASHSGNQKVGQ
jgi:hypothetical protein